MAFKSQEELRPVGGYQFEVETVIHQSHYLLCPPWISRGDRGRDCILVGGPVGEQRQLAQVDVDSSIGGSSWDDLQTLRSESWRLCAVGAVSTRL